MLTYRLATPEDITSIVTLVELAYRGESSRLGWTTEADFIDGQRTDKEEVSELLGKEHHVMMLCEEHGQLVATVQLNQSSKHAYLGMFAVDPLKQSKGLGLALLKEAETFVQEKWSSNALCMSVISIREELIAWYCRHGYVKTEKMSEFPYHEPRYGIPNRDDLVLVSLEKKFI